MDIEQKKRQENPAYDAKCDAGGGRSLRRSQRISYVMRIKGYS